MRLVVYCGTVDMQKYVSDEEDCLWNYLKSHHCKRHIVLLLLELETDLMNKLQGNVSGNSTLLKKKKKKFVCKYYSLLWSCFCN